jgi:hypothetical protein
LTHRTECALGVDGGAYAIRQAAAERCLEVGHVVRHLARPRRDIRGGLYADQEPDRGDLLGFELGEHAPYRIGDRHRVHDRAGRGRAVQPIDGDRRGDGE